jgi:hypothetical protein
MRKKATKYLADEIAALVNPAPAGDEADAEEEGLTAKQPLDFDEFSDEDLSRPHPLLLILAGPRRNCAGRSCGASR